ncbi:MAG: hypothetical protein HY293_21760 [Planctomycetes bacterium]|nr:hypothetical protein [Planctomycetota bacterium]
MRVSRRMALALLLVWGCSGPPQAAEGGRFSLATFNADITPPLGHALCGGMVAPAARIADPLSGRGIILRGDGEPVVIVALDWTELRNDAYDRWRSELAKAAGTTPRRVLLSCVHQHDAPYADLEAQRLLDTQGFKGFHVDPEFHERALQTVAAAVREAVPRRITHLGMGQAEVDRVASNRRVVVDGRVSFKRYSKTADSAIKDAPEGLIDPWLKALSFWDGDRVLAVLSAYAVHPMSTYGGGAVSADFPGLARARREQCMPGVFWMYVSGCSGDVTAAKYNNADAASRQALADRLHLAMTHAFQKTRRVPLENIGMRVEELRFDLPQPAAAMEKTLADPAASKSARLMAALGLSWAKRTARGQPIEVAALDFGPAQYLLLPAEAFVEFQLAAQRARKDQFIVVAGYGECGPGYIPTEAARKEGYVEEHGYCWVAAGAEEKLLRAIGDALK